jgi:hypothetical protein
MVVAGMTLRHILLTAAPAATRPDVVAGFEKQTPWYILVYMFIYRLTKALSSHKVKYAIAGGYAVALHGAVRGTVDVDLVLVVAEENFMAAERAFESIGLRPRLPVTAADVFRYRQEYIKNRNMTAWSFVNLQNPAELVDIIITHDLKTMKIKKVFSGGHMLPVLAIDDLIRMKSAVGRPQDWEDIKALEQLS